MQKNYGFHLGVILYIVGMSFFQQTFSFMGLNVFLAWLPIVFGQLFMKLDSGWHWLLGLLWLLFFPNIPYLLTDLFYLTSLDIYRPNGLFSATFPDWWSFLLLVLPILMMVFIGMGQVFSLLKTVTLDLKQQVASLTILAFLSGIAVYIGRFERIHSIELLIHPIKTVTLLIGDWSMAKVQFVALYSFIQLSIWGLIYFLQKMSKEE
ncbi:DUF1361 domain-containing protein [Enterococcus hermanniensis]|uniref:Uncharacterized protein n=1 Tax=Enterococcus hermanniensis TaxID=249189 RepID=A0A1L8TRE9_9ENTE|nr:DUF1361 domain-containing protein [Enterococcus hermanniensis]OJG46857.1 hypothetical protein RV04_GL000104 [Enterococcus hermanniensis]